RCVAWRCPCADARPPLENRQSATNPYPRPSMPNNVSGRRMIDDPLDVAAREPGACGDDGLSDREPVDLRISPIHAFKRDEVAVFVADGDAHIHIELPRLCDRRIHDRVCFRESQRHDTKRLSPRPRIRIKYSRSGPCIAAKAATHVRFGSMLLK